MSLSRGEERIIFNLRASLRVRQFAPLSLSLSLSVRGSKTVVSQTPIIAARELSPTRVEHVHALFVLSPVFTTVFALAKKRAPSPLLPGTSSVRVENAVNYYYTKTS